MICCFSFRDNCHFSSGSKNHGVDLDRVKEVFFRLRISSNVVMKQKVCILFGARFFGVMNIYSVMIFFFLMCFAVFLQLKAVFLNVIFYNFVFLMTFIIVIQIFKFIFRFALKSDMDNLALP